MGAGGGGGCRVRPETRNGSPGRRTGVGLPRRRLLPLVPPPPELRLPRNLEAHGSGRAPPAGARSHPRRASSRAPPPRTLRPGAPWTLRRRRFGAGATQAGPRGGGAARRGPGPPPLRPPRLLPLAVEPRRPPATLGALEPEPSRARAAAAARCSQAPSLRAGRGVGGAAGRRNEGGRGARKGIGTEDRTLSREGTPYRSAAPQLRSTWRKEEEWTPGHLFTIYPPIGSCTFLLAGRKTPKLRSNFSKKLEAKRACDEGRGNVPQRGLKLQKPLQDQG